MTALRPITHITPELRLHAGPQALERLPAELKRAGVTRAVIVAGRSLAASPEMARLRALLGAGCVGVLHTVAAHSPIDRVLATAEGLRDLGADGVIAVGGGSAVVTARAAAIALAEGADLARLATSRTAEGKLHSPRLDRQKLPQFLVPTTPTTAIVKAGSAVFEPQSGRRLALYDPKTRAQVVILDPGFLASAPMDLVTMSALDSLSLGLEGLMSLRGDALSDALLIEALFRLRQALLTEDSAARRMDLALGAILAGRGSDHTGAGAATVLGHAAGAALGLDNALVKSIVLPHVLRYNQAEIGPGLGKLARSWQIHPTIAAAEAALFELSRSLQIPQRLSQLGFASERLAEIARLGLEDWFLEGNPRPITEADQLHSILQAAWS